VPSTRPGEVGLYTCGPTVTTTSYIGNLRTYIFEDVLKRVLAFNGYTVRHVMNITDVGHLTGDRDMGEDKMEKGAQREGRTAWDIAEFYTRAFKQDIARLNILEPSIWCKATDSIPEQIDLIRILEQKGFTYKTGDGIYFDTAKFPGYARLSSQNLDASRGPGRETRRSATRRTSPCGSFHRRAPSARWNGTRPGGSASPGGTSSVRP
jgi:cysteinyl-tRNA synthetase